MVFFRTLALLVFSIMAMISRAPSNAAKSVSFPPVCKESSILRFSAYRSFIWPSFPFTRVDHLKLWIVTSNRVSNIFRLISYSLSKSFCKLSSLFHCSMVSFCFGVNKGVLNRFSPETRMVSSRWTLIFSNKTLAGMLLGGLPSPNVIEISFNAEAVGDSNSVITLAFSFGLNDSIILNAINSLIRYSSRIIFESYVCSRSDTWPEVRFAYGQVSSFKNPDSSSTKVLASSLFEIFSSNFPRIRISSVSQITISWNSPLLAPAPMAVQA